MTTLDPRTALVVIDLQDWIVALPTVHPAAEIVARSRELADAFRSQGLPVVLVTVSGGAPGRTDQGPGQPRPLGWDVLVPEMNQQPSDHAVVKRTWGAFTGTDLDDYLRRAGVTQIVLVGIASSLGVESTARFAHELGYHVTVVVDAVTDVSMAAHTNAVTHIFPQLGETATTSEIIGLLSN